MAFRDEPLYDVSGRAASSWMDRALCRVGARTEEGQWNTNMTPPPARAWSFLSRPFLLLAGSVATIGLGLAGCRATREPEHQPRPPSVTVTRSERRTVPIIVNPIGTTRALQDVTIRARVKGFLTEKHFDEGRNVKKDQLLLVIDPIPFELQLNCPRAS